MDKNKPSNQPAGSPFPPNIQGQIIEKSQKLTEDWLERGFKDIQKPKPEDTKTPPQDPSKK